MYVIPNNSDALAIFCEIILRMSSQSCCTITYVCYFSKQLCHETCFPETRTYLTIHARDARGNAITFGCTVSVIGVPLYSKFKWRKTQKSDVRLTVHRNSVWIRKTN